MSVVWFININCVFQYHLHDASVHFLSEAKVWSADSVYIGRCLYVHNVFIDPSTAYQRAGSLSPSEEPTLALYRKSISTISL